MEIKITEEDGFTVYKMKIYEREYGLKMEHPHKLDADEIEDLKIGATIKYFSESLNLDEEGKKLLFSLFYRK